MRKNLLLFRNTKQKVHPKMCIGESLSFFDNGILLPLNCGKGGICYVSKSEEVWHLVLRPLV